MKLYILKADNSKEMDDIAGELSLKKFKLIDEDDRFKLMRKRRYGNILVQIVSLLLALQVSWVFLILNHENNLKLRFVINISELLLRL